MAQATPPRHRDCLLCEVLALGLECVVEVCMKELQTHFTGQFGIDVCALREKGSGLFNVELHGPGTEDDEIWVRKRVSGEMFVTWGLW